MTWLQLAILAIIQGLTEFLPISSSAHLVLAPQLLSWETDQGPLIDVMAHFGSLFAVMAYFRKDVSGIITGFFDLLGRKLNKNSALALNLIIASPPALALGFFLNKFGYDIMLRQPLLIAFMTIVFGILLWVSDIKGREEKTTEDLTWKGAGLIVAGLSFLAAYACIALFMKWVSKIGFFPFMVYRLLLGAGLLLWIFTSG